MTLLLKKNVDNILIHAIITSNQTLKCYQCQNNSLLKMYGIFTNNSCYQHFYHLYSLRLIHFIYIQKILKTIKRCMINKLINITFVNLFFKIPFFYSTDFRLTSQFLKYFKELKKNCRSPISKPVPELNSVSSNRFYQQSCK